MYVLTYPLPTELILKYNVTFSIIWNFQWRVLQNEKNDESLNHRVNTSLLYSDKATRATAKYTRDIVNWVLCQRQLCGEHRPPRKQAVYFLYTPASKQQPFLCFTICKLLLLRQFCTQMCVNCCCCYRLAFRKLLHQWFLIRKY